MPSIKEFSEVITDKRVIETFAAPRPERVAISTLEGTGERLQALIDQGVGVSKSETAHIALQVGLFGLEDAFGVK